MNDVAVRELLETLAWIHCWDAPTQQQRPCGQCTRWASRQISRHTAPRIIATARALMRLDGHPGSKPTPLTYAHAVATLDELTPLIRNGEQEMIRLRLEYPSEPRVPDMVLVEALPPEGTRVRHPEGHPALWVQEVELVVGLDGTSHYCARLGTLPPGEFPEQPGGSPVPVACTGYVREDPEAGDVLLHKGPCPVHPAGCSLACLVKGAHTRQLGCQYANTPPEQTY